LVLAAIGGSTNAVIHLLAVARRAGVPLALADFDTVSREVGVLVDCKPTGCGYMEDFHRAGGLPVLLKLLEPLLDGSALTVSGETVAEMLSRTPHPSDWQNVVSPADRPLHPAGGLVVLRGSLAPDGAVLKAAAASSDLILHQGPALVLESAEQAARMLDDPDLDVTERHVLVLRNVGPVAAGMPEAGSLPIPRRLLAAGVRDMVRVTDGRMSGTAYGTVVLHCSPEAAVGGPLGLIESGDVVKLDVASRRLDVQVEVGEMARRKAAFRPPKGPPRGWRRLYAETVLSAHLGADLDFLSEARR
jgi:dihydroxy-acid dehydratase